VRVVISDEKTWAGTAKLLSYANYYPFGMEMPGGSWSSSKYRYGFNGKENDKETGWQDYGFRIYDRDISKFLSIDPLIKKYASLTPYQFASNSPISGIDLDGLEFFFAAGAGNDEKGQTNYPQSIMNAFKIAGITNLERVNAHHGQFSDIDFALGDYARIPYQSIINKKINLSGLGSSVSYYGGYDASQIPNVSLDDRVTSATSQIENKLLKGQQLNLAGYSMGSVLMAQTALRLADKGYHIDNLILIGTTISPNSELGKTLAKYQSEGKFGNVSYEATIGDEVLGLASKSQDEIGKIKSFIRDNILKGEANKSMPEFMKFKDVKPVKHLVLAGEKTNNASNVERKRVAEKIKAKGVQ
jgi:RHS repeat-associated protein